VRLASPCSWALAALALGAPTLQATPRDAGSTGSALETGLTFLERVLHLQQDKVISHTVSIGSREALLELDLASGRSRTLDLREGTVLIDGARVGSYAPGGPLDRSWRSLLGRAARLDTPALLTAVRDWKAAGLTGADAAAKTLLDGAVRNLATAPVAPVSAQALAAGDSAARIATLNPGVSLRLTDLQELDSVGRLLANLPGVGADVAASVRATPLHVGDYTVPEGVQVDGDVVVFRGDADVFGTVDGNVIALFGDVAYHRGAVIGRNAVSVGGTVRDLGGTVRGDVRTVTGADLSTPGAVPLAAPAAAAVPAAAVSAWNRLFSDVRNVVAVFIALAMTGFGAVFFARRYVEVVSDTARHAFGRSFVVGVLGQLLLLPTLAMLVVGLVFTIVGILLLPFAAVAFVLAAAGALLGGYLAIAHAVGETFTRRRMANGALVRSPNAYGYLFTGLIGLLGLWAAAALFGWAGPVVLLFRLAAAIVTWVAATTGFGSVLLSRAGLRETFAGRHYGEMTDEYLWATPPATPTAARMGPRA